MSAEGRISVIKLGGELDVGRRDEIEAALRLPPGARSVLLDFGGVTYADSSTLGVLVRLRNEAQAQRVKLAIVTGSRQFARLVEYAGLAELLAIFDDRAAALSYLATESP